jgi:hypothetical protein
MAFEQDFVPCFISFWNCAKKRTGARPDGLLIWLKLLPPLPHAFIQDTTVALAHAHACDNQFSMARVCSKSTVQPAGPDMRSALNGLGSP